MPDPSADDIVLGTPRFRRPDLAELARREGAGAAWRAALCGVPRERLPEVLSQVDGLFAVAVREASGRTVIAVDRFAACSLVYRIDAAGLAVAPRADALAHDAPIDLQAILDYLFAYAIPSPRTIFAGVARLPAGSFGVFEEGRVDVRPYWTPTFTEPSAPRFDGLRDEFRTLLASAVADVLDGGKPGCFLSGGTDSSTVAGLLGPASGTRASTYSIGFDAEGYDEMAYARLAAKHFGTDHHEYYVTPDDLVRSIPKVAVWYDQPFGNSSVLPTYYCAQLARDDGVTRILAGDGGDELFGGNSRYAKQRVFDWYERVPAGIRGAVLEPFSASRAAARAPLLRKGASYVRQAMVPLPDRLQMYNLLRRLGVADVLAPGFLAQVDVEGPMRGQRAVWQQSAGADSLNRMLAFDWRYTLAESDLPKVCGATALAGIEVGFPMLDQRLLDFSMRLPVDHKLKGLRLRWFFKEALRGFLPDDILRKKKQGFGLPFGVWATRHAPLLRLATDSLGSLSTRGIVRPAFIKTLITDHLPAHPGYYGEMVWLLMMLEQWLRGHRENFALR